MNARRLLCSVALSCLLAACGGGDGRGEDSLGAPQPAQRCDGCAAGRLTGTVSTGQPMAAVPLRVIDGRGREAAGQSDDAGRYDIDVSALAGALLVQALVRSGGQAQWLHAAASGTEAGQVAVNVTPITELIVAEALGGRPADLLQAGRAEFARIDASLADSETRIEAVLRPLLDAMGVAASIDLRTTPMPQAAGLAQALAALQVTAVESGYQLRHGASPAAAVQPPGELVQADDQAVIVQPGRAAGAAALPAPTPPALAAWQAGQAALPAVQQRLQQLADAFAPAMPPVEALLPWLAEGFMHVGLDAPAYVAQVLRRQDAITEGGYSLRGVAFDQLRLLQVADDGRRLLVAFRVQPAAPQPAWDERMWFRLGPAGWQLAGDGLGARVRVRHAAVLGPRPQPAEEVRRLTGAVCAIGSVLLTDSLRERCAIEGGLAGVPAPGWLDLGSPDEAGFGLRALYRSDADTPAQRLAEHAAHSRLLGQPSAQVRNHVLFEVDAWQSDPRARQVRVHGPGLPESGLRLYRPAPGAGTASFTLDPQGGEPWHGVQVGHCAAAQAGDGAPMQAQEGCAAGWQSLATGSGYRFTLLDAAGQALHTLVARLPSAPPDEAALHLQQARHFARWSLQGQPLAQPTLARLLGAPLAAGAGDALVLSQTWSPPQDPQHQALWVDLAWHRAPLPPATGEASAVRLRRLLPAAGPGAAAAALWEAALPARDGQRTIWLSVVITASDALGNRYLHAVSPDNPF